MIYLINLTHEIDLLQEDKCETTVNEAKERSIDGKKIRWWTGHYG